MKKIFLLIVSMLLIIGITNTQNIFADSTEKESTIITAINNENQTTYKTGEELLKAEGTICTLATDGCNNVMINDGKLGGMTKMYCENIYGKDGQEVWKCLKYKEAPNEKTYNTGEELLKAEGNICTLATDGCNNVTIDNGKLGAMTDMYCENIYGKDGKETWKCLEYKKTEEKKVYTNSKDFLAVEGNTCSLATDGCNNVTINDGKLGAMTMMYCENIYGKNGKEAWKCLENKKTETQKTYNNSKDFLTAEGNICSLATDGCNNVMISNGELGGMTKMYCEDTYGKNGKEVWKCLKYNEISSDDSNKDGLSNDERFYLHIKNTLDQKYQDQVKKSITLFESKTKDLTQIKKNKTIDLLDKAITKMIFNIASKFPADTALPEDINNQYFMLTLLKFELQKLKNSFNIKIKESNKYFLLFFFSFENCKNIINQYNKYIK